MPVFIVLYQVLRGLTRRVSGMGFDMGWVSGQIGTGTSTTKAPAIDRNFDPAYLNHHSKMYQDLSTTNTMQAFGMDLAESASKALRQGIVHALPYLLLIAIVGVTGFVQQRQIQGRNPNQQVNPQQQMIMKIMPIFLPVISFGLPSGLVLYFAVSNLYRVGQQWFISRSVYGHGSTPGSTGPGSPAIDVSSDAPKSTATTTAPAASGGLMASLKRAAGIPVADDASTSKSKSATASSPKKRAAPTPAKRKSTTSGRTTPPKKPAPAKAAEPKQSSKTASSSASPSPATAAKKGTTSASPPAPPLQPRARKNKKG